MLNLFDANLIIRTNYHVDLGVMGMLTLGMRQTTFVQSQHSRNMKLRKTVNAKQYERNTDNVHICGLRNNQGFIKRTRKSEEGTI